MRRAAFIATLLLVAACTESNPAASRQCQDGSCSHHDELTFCDIDGVYAASELGNECIAPPVGGCNRVEDCDPSSSTPECSSIVEGTEGTCVACTDGTHCEDGEVCDDSTNECMAFSCNPGAAGDATCAAVAASQPYCGADDACVACLQPEHCATATAAICDQTSFVCRGCEAHSECDSNVCGDLSGGECVDPAEIVYVTKGGSDVGDDCGAKDDACLTIMKGVSQTTATRSMVLVGAGTYDEQLTFTDETVTIVADGAVTLAPQLTAGATAVAVTGGSIVEFAGIEIGLVTGGGLGSVALACSNDGGGNPTVVFDGGEVFGSGDVGVKATNCTLALRNTEVRNNAGIGVSVDGGSVEVAGSTVRNNAGIGVSVDGGSVEVVGSTIAQNQGGGISVTGADFSIVNNFVIRNGTTLSAIGGVDVVNSASANQVFDFNTVAHNEVGVVADATNMDCAVSSPFTATGNILYFGKTEDSQPSVDLNGCTFVYSNIEGGPGGTNIDQDPKFVKPVAGDDRDYHLKSDSPCIDAAAPAATLDIDIDGEARPQGAGHDMGADEAG